MSLPKARSLDQISHAIEGSDRVIVPDTALSEALRSRIGQPQEGSTIYTPRQLMHEEAGPEDLLEHEEMVETVIDHHDTDIEKDIVEELIDCWGQEGSLSALKSYKRFDNGLIETVNTVISGSMTVYGLFENTVLTQSVTVIDPDRLSVLERSIIPDDVKTITTVTQEKTQIAPFHVFTKRHDLLKAMVDVIEAYDSSNVGIVVEKETELHRQARSCLHAHDIAIISDEARVPDPVRRILTVLDKALQNHSLTVGEVASCLPLDETLPEKLHHASLSDLTITAAEEARNLLSTIANSTIHEAVSTLADQGMMIPSDLWSLIEDDIGDMAVTAETVQQLRAQCRSRQWIEQDEGVVLVDPTQQTHIDRSIVMFLDMSEAWTDVTARKPWIDMKNQYETQYDTITALLQAGDRQFYFVEDQRGDEPVSPCHVLQDYLAIDRFTDYDHKRMQMPEHSADPFTVVGSEPTRKRPQTISQSDLNTLVSCPRAYLMSDLVDERDRIWYRRGTLLHDFAEFCAAHPETVEDEGLEPFVSFILEELRPFSSKEQEPIIQTKIRHGLARIKQYIEAVETEPISIGGYQDMSWATNSIAEAFDKPIGTSQTEQYFSDEVLGISGLVDFIPCRDTLVDYKSGSQRSVSAVVRSANIDLFDDDPDFQVIMYLTYHRHHRPEEQLRFTFFHFLENIEERLGGSDEIEQLMTTIIYHPQSFAETLQTEQFFEALKGDVAASNDRRKTLEKLGHHQFAQLIDDADLPQAYETDVVRESSFYEDLLSTARTEIGDYTYVENGCEKIIKRMVRLRKQRLFAGDLDRFEEFVEVWLANLHRWNQERFPVGDADLDELNNRDLVLRGDR